MSTPNLNAFPDDFLQEPDFQFHTSSGVPGHTHLGVLPSEHLLIDYGPGLILSGSDFEGLAALAVYKFRLDVARLVLIFREADNFYLVESHVDGMKIFRFRRLIHLFSAPGEFSPAHLRQLVGMLPAIRQTSAEGGGE